jgi:hypothetical protein
MTKRIFTKGNVEVQNIKIGDIHYEYEFGFCIKSEVISLPIRKDDGMWTWRSKICSSGKVIRYAVNEIYGYYGPNLYDYEAYSNSKII